MNRANGSLQRLVRLLLMFGIGKLISSTIKIVTLPIDAVNAGMDMLCGGSGSKESRTQDPTPLGLLENLRDKIADAAKDADE